MIKMRDTHKKCVKDSANNTIYIYVKSFVIQLTSSNIFNRNFQSLNPTPNQKKY